MTSADEPANIVGKLHNSKHRHDLLRGKYKCEIFNFLFFIYDMCSDYHNDGNMILCVYFRYTDDMITLFVKKNQVKGSHDEKSRVPTFAFQFVISYGRRKRIPQLEWKKYTVRR